MTSMSPLRVLVADPFPMSARGVLAVLDETEDLRLVGSVHHAHDFRWVRQLDVPFFDVVLIDAQSVDGIPALRALVAAYPRAVVVYTDVMHVTAELLAVGAPGYVSKREDGDTLVEALRTVGGGKACWSPEMEVCRHWYAEHGPIGMTPPQRRIWERNTGQLWDDS